MRILRPFQEGVKEALALAFLGKSSVAQVVDINGRINNLGLKLGDRCRNVHVIAATGSGKTTIMCSLVPGALRKGKKIILLVTINSLIPQTIETLKSFGVTHHEYGVVCAEYPCSEFPDALCQIVSLHTLRSRKYYQERFSKEADIVVFDESHSSTFHNISESIYREWSASLVIGFTASPFNRSLNIDKRYGTHSRCDAIIAAPGYSALEEQGYLVPLVYSAVDLGIKEEGQKFDFVSQYSKRLETWQANCKEKGLPQKYAIAFVEAHRQGDTSPIDHFLAQAAFCGLDFREVSDKTDRHDREKLFAAFKRGEIDGLVTVDALSTGVDLPIATHALLLRPIKSRDRYVQIIGRITRPAPGKIAGYVWDFAGNVEISAGFGQHPIIEELSDRISENPLLAIGVKEAGLAGEAPTKMCPKCKKHSPISAVVCQHCGEPFHISMKELIEKFGDRLVSLPSLALAKSDRASAIQYFRMQRQLCSQRVSADSGAPYRPGAAYWFCKQRGIIMPESRNDSEWYRGAIFGAPNNLEAAESYANFLYRSAILWGWEGSEKHKKVYGEMLLEFDPVIAKEAIANVKKQIKKHESDCPKRELEPDRSDIGQSN